MITLPRAVALALARNPDLALFPWEIRAAEARRLQAGARPNPELGAEVENVGGSLPGFSQSEITLSLAQVMELGAKRKRRVEAARGAEAVVSLDYEAARLAVTADVSARFIELLSIESQAAIADEQVRIAEETASAVAARVKAGAASPAERTRADVDLANARLERRLLDAERGAATVRLAALWGSTQPRFSGAAGVLDSLFALSPLDTLLARAPLGPEIARWEAEIEFRRRLIALERSQRVPNLALSGGYRVLRESDDRTFTAGLSIGLPVFDRNRGNVLAAEADAARSEAELARASLIRKSEIIEAHIALTKAASRVESLRQEVIPGAQRAFDEVRSGYERGRFSYLDLLEARRSLARSRQDALDGLVDYHQVLAELERLVGGPTTRPAGE